MQGCAALTAAMKERHELVCRQAWREEAARTRCFGGADALPRRLAREGGLHRLHY